MTEMRPTETPRAHHPRRGVVLGLVILVGVVVLVLGLAMISTSSGLLLTGVDSKQRIKARIAAETQATLQIAAAMEMASRIFGSDSVLPGRTLALLPTGDGMKGSSTVEQIGVSGGILPQEMITTGPYKGMKGLKIGYAIHSSGLAPGGAKGQVDVELKIYQVPIFQFGVFYQGNLEISPGANMKVFGPVHTNGSAFFRAPNSVPDASLQFQGPVTATGKIYHWMGIGSIKYWNIPEDSTVRTVPSLSTTITAASVSEVPPEVNLSRNVSWGVDSLKLPIETTDPRQLIMPKTGTEPEALKRQKFAYKASKASSWINPGNGSGRPSWITGNGALHRVFWDRREKAWVRYWNFDVDLLIKSGNKDSVFFIADTFDYGLDSGMAKKQTINAFRIINASKLPRNMSIASPNPIYIMGDFNSAATVGCYDRSQSTPPPGGDYCNAMIAADAITLLSPKWLNYKRGNNNGGIVCNERQGNLDQGSINPLWTMDGTSAEKQDGAPSDSTLPRTDVCGAFQGTITVNAALMTGNKAAPLSVLPPNNHDNGMFEGGYEGGWHNTIRFLEDLLYATVNFKGSFVCMWESSARGLNRTGKVIRTLPGGYYLPPQRNWGFDPRFKNLSNMPPATPFLATKPFTTWAERR